jgi:hypothetical protein
MGTSFIPGPGKALDAGLGITRLTCTQKKPILTYIHRHGRNSSPDTFLYLS